MKIHRFFLIGIAMFSVLWGCKPETEAEKFIKISISYSGKYRDSTALFARRAIDVGDGTPNEVALAKILSTVDLGYKYRDSAITILQEARTTLLATDQRHMGLAGSRIGDFYAMNNENDSAFKYYDEAEPLIEGLDDYFLPFRNSIYAGKASMLKEGGKFKESLRYFKKSLEVDFHPNPQNHSGIAELYLKLNDAKSALKHARRAMALSENLTDERFRKIYVIYCTGILSSVFNQLEQFDSAIYYNEKAIDLSGRNSPHIGETLYKSGTYKLQLGDQFNAIKLFNKALTLIEKSEYELIKPYHWYSTALAYQRIDTDSMYFFARRSFQKSVQKDDKVYKQLSSELLASYFKEQHRVDSSIFYLELAKDLQKEIYKTENAKQLSDLKVELETLEKEKKLQAALVDKVRAEDEQIIIVISSVAIFCILSMGFWRYRQQANLKRELLEVEKKSLSQELEKSKQLLSIQTLNMIHKNNGFSEIAENLKEANGSGSKIKKIIDVNMALEKDWKNFNEYFSHVHGDFYTKLKERHPGLSITEIRLCSMIKMGLRNKEMATILNIEYSSITMAKYRLKKKMELGEEEEVNVYVNGL